MILRFPYPIVWYCVEEFVKDYPWIVDLMHETYSPVNREEQHYTENGIYWHKDSPDNRKLYLYHYKGDLLHNNDGPAIDYEDYYRAWYRDGKLIGEEYIK